MPAERGPGTAGEPAFESKCCAPALAVQRAAELDAPRVFTNGCFDLLHRGHVTYLAQARALGGSLIVALNSDDSVRRLAKGDERPLNTLADRMAVIAALQSVDLVTWFDADTPLELIIALSPQVLAKGGDWRVEAIVGADHVRAQGGDVVSIPVVHPRSTTSLIERIRV